MKIITDGIVKPYYIQTLAMLFYPGEKFSLENDPRRAEVSVKEMEAGVFSRVIVGDGNLTEYGESFTKYDCLPKRKTVKISVGNAFYDACVKLTGHIPPWGILTGVRPAKLAEELLSLGKNSKEVYRYFVEKYRTTEEKARLAVECSLTARELSLPGAERECSVYVAIPFCPTRCSYCSFVSYTSPKLLSMIPDYLNALAEDLVRVESLIRRLDMKITTVYIGGGTPTVLDEKQLDFLLRRMKPLTDGVKEFTLEAGRPDTINLEKMKIAADYGATRVSVNTQTLNDEILASVGRKHTRSDFFKAYEYAANSGIRSKNVDLIAGLPGESAESFFKSVDDIVDLGPESITVHTFSVKKSARLKTDGEDVFDREGRDASAAVSYSQSAILKAGYKPYYMYRQKNTVGNLENVGYSVPGHEGLYNVLMMDELHSIFSCGASAVTKLVSPKCDRIYRIFEPKYPYEYLERRRSLEFKEEMSDREKIISDFFK